jgi:predicted dehydrogenase
MTKRLNVGIIGYGFMGRTHSNAYRKVRNFFDVPYEPVLKTICGLDGKEAQAFADRWGFQSHTTDWRRYR